MKVYLASRYSRRLELRCYALDLERLGHHVVSRWIWREGNHVQEDGSSALYIRQLAEEDISDIRSCDVFLLFSEEPRNSGHGGRLFEFGIAYGLGKRCIAIGPPETIFHYIGEVSVVSNWEAVLELCA